ncbi:hypothetical protein SAMN05519105_3933 [Rhodobacter sp. 24-YEA-8]|nr:hypothetical protein SAMN05519105_3933 [Rhodobacter sp. 24-YEA-8]
MTGTCNFADGFGGDTVAQITGRGSQKTLPELCIYAQIMSGFA